MVKKNNVLLVLLVLLILQVQNCQRVSDINIQELSEAGGFQIDKEEYVLLVPQNGCSTCVKKSYEFILKHYNSDQIKFVFTHYSSKKAVRVRFNLLGIEDASSLAYIDLNRALELGASQMYPSLITLGESGTGSMIYMNAEDGSDWKNLEEAILN